MRWTLPLLLVTLPSTVIAVPGPDSTVVVASSSVAESLSLARDYARTRGLPQAHVCAVPVDDRSTIGFAEYETSFEAPLVACLQDRGLTERIEAFVIARGLPIRVTIPTGSGNRRVALAALLGVWDSRIIRGERLAGTDFGIEANCGGTPCYAARYRNPYTNGVFSADYAVTLGGVEWTPKLVTMLHGRSYDQARRLIASATTAEALGPIGRFVFMEAANPPRAVLDRQFPAVQQQLEGLGFEVDIVPFDADRSFAFPIAGFVTGSQSMGDTIEANTYAPGSLVDNLTSLGAVPANFTAEDERQVSIARWIERGAAGVHGCTDEPLNNVFPSRGLMTDYARGYTLAESFLRRMPFAYWRNLVVGDPMAAPYAVRPQVMSSVFDGETLSGGTELDFEVLDDRVISSLRVYLDGVEIAAVEGPTKQLSYCLEDAPSGDFQLLAVAQVDGVSDEARPKGWVSLGVTGDGSNGRCDAPLPDMGVVADVGPDMADAGVSDPDLGSPDMGVPDPDLGVEPMPMPRSEDPPDAGGCQGATQSGFELWLLSGLLFALRRRRGTACV